MTLPFRMSEFCYILGTQSVFYIISGQFFYKHSIFIAHQLWTPDSSIFTAISVLHVMITHLVLCFCSSPGSQQGKHPVHRPPRPGISQPAVQAPSTKLSGQPPACSHPQACLREDCLAEGFLLHSEPRPFCGGRSCIIYITAT